MVEKASQTVTHTAVSRSIQQPLIKRLKQSEHLYLHTVGDKGISIFSPFGPRIKNK